jgi:acyl carrier protein
VDEEKLDVQQLREELQRRIPEYMVPSSVVIMDHLPLTAHGKLDKSALPVPEFHSQSNRLPKTPKEEILYLLFVEVLGIETVGIDDSFFALGGDSIGSIRLVGKAHKAGLSITTRDVFQYQSIEKLAMVAREGEAETAQEAKAASESASENQKSSPADTPLVSLTPGEMRRLQSRLSKS